MTKKVSKLDLNKNIKIFTSADMEGITTTTYWKDIEYNKNEAYENYKYHLNQFNE